MFNIYDYMMQENYDRAMYVQSMGVEERKAFFQEQIDKELKYKVGKYVFCSSPEDGDTRLFIKSISALDEVEKKDGWWDIFTLSDTPCKKGYNLCIIEKFRTDKNGYINVIVHPVRNIGEQLYEPKKSFLFRRPEAWSNITKSSKLFNGLKFDQFEGKNVRNFIEKIEEKYNICVLDTHGMNNLEYRLEQEKERGKRVYTSLEMLDMLFSEYAEGRFDLLEMQICLEAPTKYELFLEEIERKLLTKDEEFKKEYPLFVKKYNNEKESGYVVLEDFLRYIYTNYELIYGHKEENLLLNNLQKAEKVLEYREIKKKEKKYKTKAEKAQRKKLKEAN